MSDEVSCPCGQVHTGPSWDIAVRIARHVGLLVEVRTPSGGWFVPRVFIAMHGLLAKDLPELAKKYGWKKFGSELS